MLLLSLFTFLGFTPAKNNVLSDSAGSPPNDSQKTPPLPLTAPNNFSLNWENEYFQKNAFRTFLRRLSMENDNSETLSPMGLKEIVNLFQTIIIRFQASNNKKNKKIQLKLFENDFDKETKFSRVIIWFMELYHQAQKTDISTMNSVNFNPQEKNDYLLEAMKALINFEEFYLEVKSLPDCTLLWPINCISIDMAFKPDAKEKVIDYKSFIKVLYNISKWIYIHFKNELAWDLKPDGTLDLNWVKNAFLLEKLKQNPVLSKDLKDELINILLEKIQFQFYDSEEKTFSQDNLLEFIKKYFAKKHSFLSSLGSRLFDFKNIIKNFVLNQVGDLGKATYNILKKFMQVTLILREVFAKNTVNQQKKFQIKNFFTVLRRFLQVEKKNELNDKNIKILIGQILNIILNFNKKISLIWNPQPEIKAEIQNLLNDYAQPFYNHLQEINKIYQEYVWEDPKQLFFSGIIMPYIGNKSAEDNEILTIQWISNKDNQKYTIALRKTGNSNFFDVLYFAPNHWINPLRESLQSYITEL